MTLTPVLSVLTLVVSAAMSAGDIASLTHTQTYIDSKQSSGTVLIMTLHLVSVSQCCQK